MNNEIFNDVVSKLNTSIDKNGNHLNLVSLIVTCNGNLMEHNFEKPEAIDIRSIAKPILCLAMGKAINDGLYFNNIKITLDTPVWQFLSNYSTITSQVQRKKWEQIKLIDLFRITIGHDKGIMFSSDLKTQNENNLVDYVVNYPITNEIGTHFEYSNAGAFLISTLISEYLNETAEQFVDRLIFSKLDIHKYTWRKFGKYTAGCTGLKMFNSDLHKIALLIYNNGIYRESEIVPKSWIDLMRTPQVQPPTHRYIEGRAFPKWSYGLNLWICETGEYYCDGTDGQYVIIIPNKNTIITTTGYQQDTQPVSECLGAYK